MHVQPVELPQGVQGIRHKWKKRQKTQRVWIIEVNRIEVQKNKKETEEFRRKLRDMTLKVKSMTWKIGTLWKLQNFFTKYREITIKVKQVYVNFVKRGTKTNQKTRRNSGNKISETIQVVDQKESL